MKVHEQLAVLREALDRAGWSRVNGNTWRWGVLDLKVAYVWGEATLELTRVTPSRTAVTLGPQPDTHYRGSEPLAWLKTDVVPGVVKNLATELDKLLAVE